MLLQRSSHNEYKDVLLNNTCIRDSMHGIESKDHRIEIYEIYKFHCFALMTKYIFKTMNLIELIRKSSYLNNYLKKLFVKHIV